MKPLSLLLFASCALVIQSRAQDVGKPAADNAIILEGHQGSVLSVEFSADGSTLVSGSRDGTIKFWDVATRTLKCTLTDQAKNVYGVRFSPKGDLLVSCGEDKMIRL